LTQLAFHIGYPKTGTTTLQTALFPRHPEIDYGGKLIPFHRYRDERLFPQIHDLITASDLRWCGGTELKEYVLEAVRLCDKPLLLYSTESFLHPETLDILTVARRLHDLFPHAKIIITFRNQLDLLYSFYRSHGAFGEYLFIMKYRDEPIVLPLSIEKWMEYQFRTIDKNLIGILFYDSIARTYSSLFGRANIHLSLFEKFTQDPKEYLLDLAEFLGINASIALDLVSGHRENVALSQSEWAAVSDHLRLSYLESLEIAQDADTTSPTMPINSPQCEIPQPWQSRVTEMFRTSNRSLEDEFKLPLGGYGYPV
jgi:hypothetical protein